MARDKSRGNGGTNGDGGASAEVSAPEVALVSSVAGMPPEPAADASLNIAPGAQVAESNPALMSTPELLTAWHQTQLAIGEHEKEAAALESATRPIEQELCERYRKAAAEQNAEPIVEIGDFRMKVKARPAKQGGGFHLVDAKIKKAAVVPV